MSQKKQKKKGQEATAETVESDKATKKDYTIASYLKKNTPTKRTKFLHHQVDYFYASKAIDVLLDSEWATGKQTMFTDRQSCVKYCNRLLTHKFFHRARKIAVTDKDFKPKELKKKREREEKERKKKEAKKRKDAAEGKNKDLSEKEGKKNDGEDKSEDKGKEKKKKQKIKLDMHLDQVFVDGADAYVWMYDPIPFWYYVVGALCLLAAVAVCLFPLWPPTVRKGVYYLSLAAAGFLGVILGLAVLRFIAFMLIWVLSLGRHHLWLLPNLTEDVGFFASFWPLYHYEYRGSDYEGKKGKKNKKVVVVEAEEGEEEEAEEEAKKSDKDGEADAQSAADTDRPETDGERHDEATSNQSNTDSDNSHQSQSFEMLDKEELEDEDEEDDEEEEEDEERDVATGEEEATGDDDEEGVTEGEGNGDTGEDGDKEKYESKKKK